MKFPCPPSSGNEDRKLVKQEMGSQHHPEDIAVFSWQTVMSDCWGLLNLGLWVVQGSCFSATLLVTSQQSVYSLLSPVACEQHRVATKKKKLKILLLFLILSCREKSFWERFWKSREFEMEKGYDSLASKHREAWQVTLPYHSILTMSQCLWECRVSLTVDG